MRDDPAGEADPGASLRLVVPPKPSYSRYVRDRTASFIRSHGVAEADIRDFVTAVGEAVANAFEHANTQRKIEVTCWLVAGDQLLATVVDAGVGFDTSDPSEIPGAGVPEPYAERGRGLSIMHRCADHVVVRSAPGKGTAVILTRLLRDRHLRPVRGPERGG